MMSNSLMRVIAVLVAIAMAYFGLTIYRHRSRINDCASRASWVDSTSLALSYTLTVSPLQPMPAGWSWLFGHAFVILKYTKRLLPLANVVLALEVMSDEFAETEMFLIDLWPSYPTSLIIFNPEALHMVSQKWNLPRPLQSLEAIKPIVGGPNIVSMNRSEWKT